MGGSLNRFSDFRSRVKTAEAVRPALRTRFTPLKWGFNESVLALLVVSLLHLNVAAAAPKPYFQADSEATNALRFWTKAAGMEYEINSLDVSPDKAHTGKQSMKLDVTLTGDHYIYFSVPVNQRIEPGRSYYASGRIYVEQFPARGRNLIGLGDNRIMRYGAGRKQHTSGSYLFDSVRGPTNAWITMESLDLGREAPASAASVGLPTDTLEIESIFLAIHGEFKDDRVVVYLDDVALRPVAEKPELPVAAGTFPILTNVFPFGIYGDPGGFRDADASGAFRDWFPTPLWRTIPDFKRHHINAVIGGAAELFADSPAEKWDKLGVALDLFGAHGIHCLPITYFSRYYRSDLTREVCEAAIRKQVPRFRDKPAVLAWYIIDEPESSKEALADYLWAQKIINEVDPVHPVTTGGNMYNYIFDRHRPLAIFDRYPLREQSRSPWSIAQITRLIYRDASGPVWYIAPAFHNITGEYPRPTRAEFDLMCFAALANGAKGLFFYEYRQRPTWLRMASTGLVDVFEVGSDLWDEVGKLGHHLSAIGPLLLDTELVEDFPIEVKAERIKIEWAEQIPAISVGALKSRSGKRLFLVAYNNDIDHSQKAQITMAGAQPGTPPSEAVEHQSPPRRAAFRSLFDLFALVPVKYDGTFSVDLQPGEGRIYLLAEPGEFARCKAQILASRFAHEKEMALYELTRAELSGLATAGLADQLKKARSPAQLKRVEKRLAAALNSDPQYKQIGDRLDAVQRRLSDINLLYEAKITSLESTVPSPSRYVKRAYNPTDPAVRGYLDRLQDVGACYFALRNLYLKGAYREMNEPVTALETLSATLADNARASFEKETGIQKPPVADKPLAELNQTIAALQQTDKRFNAARFIK
jgi:hypothetical protein